MSDLSADRIAMLKSELRRRRIHALLLGHAGIKNNLAPIVPDWDGEWPFESLDALLAAAERMSQLAYKLGNELSELEASSQLSGPDSPDDANK